MPGAQCLIPGPNNPIDVVSTGVATSVTGATMTLTGVTIASGRLIAVAVFENNTTGVIGTLSDGTNTYTAIGSPVSPNGSSAQGIAQLFYVPNCAALSSATITYTKNDSTAHCVMSVLDAGGIATSSPLDTAVTATATGNGTSASVTSGTPAQAGELFVGCTFTNGTGTPAVSAAFSIPFTNVAASSAARAGGGHLVNAYARAAPFSTTQQSEVWCSIVAGFKHA